MRCSEEIGKLGGSWQARGAGEQPPPTVVGDDTEILAFQGTTLSNQSCPKINSQDTCIQSKSVPSLGLRPRLLITAVRVSRKPNSQYFAVRAKTQTWGAEAGG